MLRLTRRQDATVDRFRRAARRAASESCVLLDGEHLIEDAIAAGLPLDVVIGADDRWRERPDLADRLATLDHPPQLFAAAPSILDAVSPVKTPTGFVALARWSCTSLTTSLGGARAFVLAAVDVQDPGNFGAIVRSADALGATGVVAIGATADPAGWKALRGTMGSAFRVPIARASLDQTLSHARASGLTVLAAALDGTPIDRCDLARPVVVLLGSEGLGLPDAALAAADEHIAIPMRAGINSLNVAVSAALIAYEARRQRA
jgi:TrmH family RNA methyltransferase